MECVRVLCVGLVSLALCHTGLAQGVEPAASEEVWEVLLLQGNRIGYNHSVTREVVQDGQTLLITENLGQMTLKRAGQVLSTTFQLYVEETPEGALHRFRSTLTNPPNSRTEQTGLVQGDQLLVSTISAGQTTKQTVPEGGRLKSSVYVEHALRERDLPEGESIQFDTFDPQLGQVTTITLKRFSPESTKVWGGEVRRLERLIMTSSGLPGVMSTIYFDGATRKGVKTTVPLIGMETFVVTKEEALQEIEAFDQLVASLIRVEANSDLNAADEATYRLSIEGSVAPELFPNCVSQQVERSDSREVVITVRPAGPQRSNSTAKLPPPGQEYLQESRCVECTAPLIVELSQKGCGEAATPAAKALALEKFVRGHIHKRNLATAMATALEVAESQSGDCTEHSVLLTALLRAAGIPARVVMGLVYSHGDKAFVGHMWTEAWIDGVWQPLDATRAQGGTGCGHIKLNDSALSGSGAVPGAEFLPLAAIQGRTKISVTKTQP